MLFLVTRPCWTPCLSGSLAESGIEFSAFMRSGVTDERWPDLQLYLIGTAVMVPADVFNLNEEVSPG